MSESIMLAPNPTLTLLARCNRCSGKGLYRGKVELRLGKGVYTVCQRCDGSGVMKVRYNPPFARPEILADVQVVRVLKGTTLKEISYRAFQEMIGVSIT